MEHLLVRHTLDVMHVEQNVTDNVLRTILGEKDTPAVQEDMRELHNRLRLWLQERPNIPMGTKLKPHAPYMLTTIKLTEFLSTIG